MCVHAVVVANVRETERSPCVRALCGGRECARESSGRLQTRWKLSVTTKIPRNLVMDLSGRGTELPAKDQVVLKPNGRSTEHTDMRAVPCKRLEDT